MQTDVRFLRPLIENILRHPTRAEWTVQGFGFLRTYFGGGDNPKKFRLNLWDHHFTVPDVSTIHDHPWDFTSIIVAGEFHNQRYDMVTHDTDRVRPMAWTHVFSTIRCGEGGGMEHDAAEHCVLNPKVPEHYNVGDIYHQKADEIHQTLFEDGSVTLNERIGDTERARVFWPYGTEWVTAEPRKATTFEVQAACDHALRRWF